MKYAAVTEARSQTCLADAWLREVAELTCRTYSHIRKLSSCSDSLELFQGTGGRLLLSIVHHIEVSFFRQEVCFYAQESTEAWQERMWMRDGWVNMLYDVRNDTTTKRYRCCSPSASTLYKILNAYYLQGDVSHSRLTISTFQRVEILSS